MMTKMPLNHLFYSELFKMSETDNELEDGLIYMSELAMKNKVSIYDEIEKALKRHYKHQK